MTVSGAGTLTLNGKALKTIANSTTMQEVNSCPASLTTGQVYTIKDSRDNTEYHTAKLADGNCWMTENLRLFGKTITSDDSNLPEGETWTVPTGPSTFGGYDYNVSYTYINGYGGYYNFYVATAGWGTGGENGVAEGNSPRDICPKGWRLPTGGAGGEFEILYNNYHSPELMQGEPGFVLSGYRLNSSDFHQDSTADLWSSSVRDTDQAYRMTIESTQANAVAWLSKGFGFAVRCIAI
jgi:uncharacterized protein (TIGR02145 family)